MLRTLSPVLFVLAALACGSVFAQGPAKSQDPLAKLAKLQDEVDALKAEVARLKTGKGAAAAPAEAAGDVAKLRTDLDQVVKYLQAQAESARALDGVLDDSEAKGFTFGINPDSRVALLAGWRAFTGSLQTDVPGQPPAPAGEGETER